MEREVSKTKKIPITQSNNFMAGAIGIVELTPEAKAMLETQQYILQPTFVRGKNGQTKIACFSIHQKIKSNPEKG